MTEHDFYTDAAMCYADLSTIDDDTDELSIVVNHGDKQLTYRFTVTAELIQGLTDAIQSYLTAF